MRTYLRVLRSEYLEVIKIKVYDSDVETHRVVGDTERSWDEVKTFIREIMQDK